MYDVNNVRFSVIDQLRKGLLGDVSLVAEWKQKVT